jgi:hypothetical protein
VEQHVYLQLKRKFGICRNGDLEKNLHRSVFYAFLCSFFIKNYKRGEQNASLFFRILRYSYFNSTW